METPDISRLKLLELPLVTLDGGAIDVGPLLGLLALLGLALAGLLLARRKQPWRYLTQALSFVLFVWFFHRTMCVLRAWVFGVQYIGRDDGLAFLLIHVAVALVAIALLAGGIFCGWMCPLGAVQEHVGRLVGWLRRRLGPSTLFILDMALAVAAVVVMISLLVWFAPTNFFVSEYASAVFTLVGLAFLPLVVAIPVFDRRLRRFRTFSLVGRVVIVLLGIYVTNPGCTLYETEVDYSAIVTFIGVLMAAAVVMRAYCRYVCPFGALFGLLGRVALIRITPHEAPCTRDCGGCGGRCPGGALDRGVIDRDFCIMCGRCVEGCGATIDVRVECEGEAPDSSPLPPPGAGAP